MDDNQTQRLREVGLDEYTIQCVMLDDTDLDGEFSRVAADLAYWNAVYAQALREYLTQKAAVKQVRARRFVELRVELMQADLAEEDDDTAPPAPAKAKAPKRSATPRVTDGRVQTAVDCDAEVVDAEMALIEAEVAKVQAQNHADEVLAKKDALQSIGARVRRELDADPEVRRRHAQAREAARDREEG